MFIPQNHPESQQRVRTCAVIEKPVFRASLALSMLEIELYQIFLPYDRGRLVRDYRHSAPINVLLRSEIRQKTAKNILISILCSFLSKGT